MDNVSLDREDHSYAVLGLPIPLPPLPVSVPVSTLHRPSWVHFDKIIMFDWTFYVAKIIAKVLFVFAALTM